ncbi:hypothetical protein XENOCAPTIV_011046, partial [Xenoophorus captivus]
VQQKGVEPRPQLRGRHPGRLPMPLPAAPRPQGDSVADPEAAEQPEILHRLLDPEQTPNSGTHVH